MLLTFCNRAIQYLFYALFFFAPLIFLPVNSELFEFNKMIFTYLVTILIVFFWSVKMVALRRVVFRRTPLDIPIALFLLSQILATITSIDMHTSVWGYYSRSNGGLASLLSYVFLYYAFISNFSPRQTVKGVGVAASMVKRQTSNVTDTGSYTDTHTIRRLLLIALASGTLVAIYGVLERLGIDKDFWVQDVQNRVFSTLGQPNWLAAYLSVLTPISIAFGIKIFESQPSSSDKVRSAKFEVRNSKWLLLHTSYFILLTSLFYLTLLFTKSRSGFVGFGIGLIFFLVFLFLSFRAKRSVVEESHTSKSVKRDPSTRPSDLVGMTKTTSRYVLVTLTIFIVITFVFGAPFEQLNRFTLDGIRSQLHPSSFIPHPSNKPQGPALEVGGTESGDIRKIVWKGAIDIAKANPLLGTGVETFAYSYYKYRPVEHNKTSEWDFLYNKAHNEYLNYLANTGFIGLGAYLLMIGTFLWTTLRKVLTIECRESKMDVDVRRSKIAKSKVNPQPSNFKIPASTFNYQSSILVLALLAAYISILVSNFFGFSVVVTNLYLFLIPAFVFILNEQFSPKQETQVASYLPAGRQGKLQVTGFQWIGLAALLVTCYVLLIYIFRMWEADRNYALGESLDKSGEYASAYPYLAAAIQKRPGEPIFSEELSTAASTLAIAAIEQKETTLSAQLADEAVRQSNYTVKKSPNNPTFWRTRIHVLFTLSQIDPKYQEGALAAAKKATELAPTDPKIAYNYALILGQSEKIHEAIAELERAVALKPDYRDPVYALGLFYHEKGVNDKAVKQMENVLKLASDDAEAKGRLKEWRGF